MPGTIIDDALLTEAATTFDTSFQTAYQDAANELAALDAFVMDRNSTSKKTKWPIAGMLPRFRRWKGERIYHALNRYALELENETWEDSVEVDVDDLEDDQLGGYAPFFSELGRQGRMWKRDLVIEKLAAAESSLAFDGQYFFDTDHPVDPQSAAAGTYANLLVGSGYNLDDGSGGPRYSAFDTARAAMSRIKGPDGRAFGTRPVVAMVPPQLEGLAKRIFTVPTVLTGGQNIYASYGVQVLVVPELDTDATSWYLFGQAGGLKPLLFQTRMAPRIEAPSTDDVFKHNRALYGAKARGAAGFFLPFLAMKMKVS